MTTYVRTVEDGSFTRAARSLGITPAMVGRQIRALEEHLGAQLLMRTTRRQSQTEAGRIFYERARAALLEIEAAEESVTALRSVPRGVLRIDAPLTFGGHQLAPALPRFLAEHPEIRVDLTLNNRVVDLVEEGFDAVIRVGELADSGLMARKLAPYRLIACAAPRYLRRHGHPSTPSELTAHACLRFHPEMPNEAWTFFDRAGEPTSVRVSGPLACNHGQALLEAAIGGAGILLQPEGLVSRAIAQGKLVPILKKFRPEEMPVHVLYSVTQKPPPKLRVFLDFLSAHFGGQ